MSHVSLLDRQRRRGCDDDDDAWETLEDGTRILRDGRSITVRLDMMDSLQRTVAASDMASRAARAIGDADADLHRPGFRFADAVGNIVSRDASEAARTQQIIEDSNAWRTPATTFDASGSGMQREGDICTVRSGGVDEGSPGHLRMVAGKLVCVPDKRTDATPTGDARQAAYDEYLACLRDAWRTPP